MWPESARTQGHVFLAVAVVLVVGTVGAGWALAPSVDDPSGDPSRSLLVGVQAGPVAEIDGNGTVEWAVESGSHFDVTEVDNDTVIATVTRGGVRNCGRYEPPCARTGFQTIRLTPDPEVVSNWTIPVPRSRDSQIHDVEVLDSGRVAVADMAAERVFVVDPDTGTVHWQWNASSVYDPPPDPLAVDWLHVNDVDHVGEDRFLVSVRNENQLLVVERGEGVVETINEDGDPSVLNRQHNPQWLGPNAVLVADSHNDRVVELHRRGGTWEVAWSVRSAAGVPFDWPRDADRLPGGTTLVTDTRNSRVVEIAENGTTVASYSVPGRLPYEADLRGVGETVGAEAYEPRAVPLGRTSGDVPVLSVLLLSLRQLVKLPFWLSEGHLLAFVAGGVALVGAADRYVESVRRDWTTDVSVRPEWLRRGLSVCRVVLAGGAFLAGLGLLATGVTVFLSEETGLRVGLGFVLLLVGWAELRDAELERLSLPSPFGRVATYGRALVVPASLATAGLLAYVSFTWSIAIAETYRVLALLLVVCTLRLVTR